MRAQRPPVEGPGGQPPRFASAALSTYGTQLGVAMLSFVSVLIVARELGPAGRGDVALLTTIAVLSSNLAMVGIDEANINLAGVEPKLRAALATNSLLLAVVFGALCIAALIALIAVFPVLGGESDPTLRWVAFAAIPVLILKVYLKYLIGADYRFNVANASWLLPPLITVIANVVLAVAGALTVAAAFSTWAVAHGLATAFLIWYVARRGAGFGRPSVPAARRALAFGAKSYLSRVLLVGNYRADQWFVGAAAGSRELGLYSIAVAWAEVLFYLPTALVIVQRPYLVRASAREAVRRTVTVLRASLVITAPFVAALVLLAPGLCTFVFGDRFRGSIDDLRLLALGAFGIVALKLLGNALTAQRRPELATLGAAVAFAVTIALDIVLIPAHGGLGAAIASTLAYTAGGLAAAVIFVRVFDARLAQLVPARGDVPALARETRQLLRRKEGAQRRASGYGSDRLTASDREL